jgi:FixJ family two-component response regulator
MKAASKSKASLIGIVDDDSGVRESISRLVRSAGFRAALFFSAEDFLQSEELKHVACLILDVRMPGITRLDLQTRLVERAWRLPIIFATGCADKMRKGRRSMRARWRFCTSLLPMKPCSMPYVWL